MRTLALGFVVAIALSGIILETALGPTPPQRGAPAKTAEYWRQEFDFLDALIKKGDRELLAMQLQWDTPAYLDSLEDHGIMTRDWYSACTLCEGWGIQNRHRGDRAVFCESCHRTGLRETFRLMPVDSSSKGGISRVVER